MKKRCVIILSCKSSGSSICQKILTDYTVAKCIRKSRHFQNETLYWTKAASILSLPQQNMLDSEVPIPKERALNDLILLLKQNATTEVDPTINGKDLIFYGWHRLCEVFAPVFIEKSPHHLFQWSALELIIECMNVLNDIDFFFLGLVRHPMDTLYSAFSRWKTQPELLQHEWRVSYVNLLKLSSILKEKLLIVRYEDIVSDPSFLAPVFRFCGSSLPAVDPSYLHLRSIHKWQKDKRYGFSLSNEVADLAIQFGYDSNSFRNETSALWPFYRDIERMAYRVTLPIRKLIGKIKTNIITMRENSND